MWLKTLLTEKLQQASPFSKLTIETLEKGVKYVLVALFLNLNVFQTFFAFCYCWLRTGKYLLEVAQWLPEK